jgi:hypothetical protein
MGTELATIFTDGPSEYTSLLSATPNIDLTDWPCGPTTTCPSVSGGSATTITGAVQTLGYYEVQFHLANSFWGCNMNYGNSACGINIRQGIAHMVDKTVFTTTDPNCIGTCTPIDNPLPTTIPGNLPGANPCGWDSSFSQAGCTINSPGGTAYRLGPGKGTHCFGCQDPGSPDLDAAAAHFVTAGIATGCDGGSGPSSCTSSTDSILSGISPSATAAGQVPTFYIRSDDQKRFDLGNAYAEQICYLFTGAFTPPPPCAYLNVIQGGINVFPGFLTSPTSVNLSWWMYTGGYVGGFFFDSSLYFNYNSRFVSASCSSPGTASCATQLVGGGFCSNSSVQSSSAADYMYLCDPTYDSLGPSMESASCAIASSNDVSAQVGATANLVNCSGVTQAVCNIGPASTDCPTTVVPGLSAQSAAYQVEDIYGQGSYTIPVYETKDQYGYLNGWTRMINDPTGLANFFTWLNAYNPTPAQVNTIRQGLAQDTNSLNPYTASTAWDFDILGNIYDSLYMPNPLNPGQAMNWMTISTTQEANSQLTYTPPGGACTGAPTGTCTVTTYRFTLIPGLTFQDGTPVTSYDVAFSYLSLLGTGAFQSGGASSVVGITILGPHQFDFNLDSNGPSTLADITGLALMPEEPGLTIMPGRLWTNNVPGWNSGISTCTGINSDSCYPIQYYLGGTPAYPTATPGTGSSVSITSTTTSGSTTVTTTVTGGFAGVNGPIDNVNSNGATVGQTLTPVTGPGIPSGTTVASVSGSTLTLSQAATATGTVILTFVNDGLNPTGPTNFPSSNIAWDPSKITSSYDPLASGILIGSSAWQCNAPLGGPNCSSNHTMHPPIGGSFTLSANPNYIHSSNNLALWIWASNGNPLGPSTLTFSFASACYDAVGVPVGTSGVPSSYTTGGSSATQACGHWQEGIGGPSGIVAAGTPGTALINDLKITYVGGSTFAVGDPIIYNLAGGPTYQNSDVVISNPLGTTLTAGVTALNTDPLLRYYDNPGLDPAVPGVSTVFGSPIVAVASANGFPGVTADGWMPVTGPAGFIAPGTIVNSVNQSVSATVPSVSTTSGSTTVTVASGGFPGVVPGLTVKGAGIVVKPATTVSSVNGNSLTLSQAAMGTTGTVPSVSTTSGSTTVTVASGGFPGVVPGMLVTGTGIASGTTVVSVSGNSITLSQAATATGTVTLTFGVTLTFTGSTVTLSNAAEGTGSVTLTFNVGVWSNGKSVVYDTDNSGGYDFGDISSSPYSNSLGMYILPTPGIHIGPPPPSGCPASASSGCWMNEGSTQIGLVSLRVGYNWISPFNWALSAPTGIAALPPVLYQPDSIVPLNPASFDGTGCTNPFSITSTTSGGYDC